MQKVVYVYIKMSVLLIHTEDKMMIQLHGKNNFSLEQEILKNVQKTAWSQIYILHTNLHDTSSSTLTINC